MFRNVYAQMGWVEDDNENTNQIKIKSNLHRTVVSLVSSCLRIHTLKTIIFPMFGLLTTTPTKWYPYALCSQSPHPSNLHVEALSPGGDSQWHTRLTQRVNMLGALHRVSRQCRQIYFQVALTARCARSTVQDCHERHANIIGVVKFHSEHVCLCSPGW